MWIFVATEVLLFGGLLFRYFVYRHAHPQAFVEASRHTDILPGTTNTRKGDTRDPRNVRKSPLRWELAILICAGPGALHRWRVLGLTGCACEDSYGRGGALGHSRPSRDELL
ncbi:hypothetical protein [Bradyrhizobium liaoningense]